MLTWSDRKRPDEILDYYFDAGPWIEPRPAGDAAAQETVSTLVASVLSGTVTITSQAPIGAVLKMQFAGGALGEVAMIGVALLTSKGRFYTEVARLRIGG